MCRGCGAAAGSTGVQLLLSVSRSPRRCFSTESPAPLLSLGPGPHSHLGHREKECADLMMYRKSEEPHSDPGAAIGRHSSSESPAHFELESRTKGMQNESMWIHSQSVCMGTRCALLRSFWVFHFSSHLCRGRGGPSEARQSRRVETECEELYPLKADGKLVGGTEGLSTEADCHK
ncbi:Basal cell adhesion molecule [Dissostichus eleginoides]|uniref:Basal cell adhesion molecule n=1 Tax=Dissostichus eleginoides TaxID=100907 RepID=A0AAD9FJB6_DISEL|nr:Basal cell adhesion molecule [Dissostichus eleginoides]